ncbi:hypothetical protein CR513_04216, partial [Mucuna pruriens]
MIDSSKEISSYSRKTQRMMRQMIILEEKLKKLKGGLEFVMINIVSVNAKVDALSKVKGKIVAFMHESEASRNESLNSPSNMSLRENDANTNLHNLGDMKEEAALAPQGSMTRGRLKRMQEEVNKELAMLHCQKKTLEGHIVTLYKAEASKFSLYFHSSMQQKYNDEILCNVAPMEATHIPLGKLWQYEKVTLKPLSPIKVSEDQLKMKIKKEKEQKE